jgi:hypothetical protein
MPIGAPSYSKKVLPKSHREALLDACSLLTDQFFDDVVHLMTDGDFSETRMVDFLPRKYLPRYDALFAKQFLVCFTTVSWRLFSPGEHRLTCVAEELALSALIDQAEAVLDSRGKEANFDHLVEIAFEDMDFEALFDPAQDGIEDTVIGKQLGMQFLRFDDWFRAFNRGAVYRVHPYVGEGPKPRKKKAGKGKPAIKFVKKTKEPKGKRPKSAVPSKRPRKIAFEKIWEEQLTAALGMKERLGPKKALGYLIGEKLLNFIEASDTRPEFASELPAFVAAIKEHFASKELQDYLGNVKRVGALGHIVESDEAYEEFRKADARDNPVAAAEDAILLERAKKLLLDESAEDA